MTAFSPTAPLHIVQLPALDDNYIYLLSAGRHTIAIDPGEAEPVLDYLQHHQLQLDLILNTHMHHDHCGGNLALKRHTGCHIAGGDERIPGIDLLLTGERHVPGLGELVEVLYTPGHTQADCCYHLPAQHALFSGDTLFSGGCGRVFEGSMEQLFRSLQQLQQLPAATQLYCGHEYSEDNYRFAASIEPSSTIVHTKLAAVRQQRRQQQPSIPVTLQEERRCNPFLRCNDPLLRRALKREHDSDLDVFTDLRQRKNRF